MMRDGSPCVRLGDGEGWLPLCKSAGWGERLPCVTVGRGGKKSVWTANMQP